MNALRTLCRKTGRLALLPLIPVMTSLPTSTLIAQEGPDGAAPTASGSSASAEEKATGLEQVRPDEPVDLALEFMLRESDTGSSVFAKRALELPKPLATAELDAINSPSKEDEIAIPLRGYPSPDQPPLPNRPVYAEARLGLHLTTGLRAGLSGTSWPFDYHAAAGFESTNGYVENGERSKFSLQLGGGYVIGLGYGIFSGGHMGASGHYTTESYRLYGAPDAAERSHVDWGVSATGTAAYAGIDFEGIGRVRRAGIDEEGAVTANSELAETSVEGVLTMKTKALGLGWQGIVDLRLTNATPGSINYGAFDLSALFETGILSLRAGAGLSSGGGTAGESIVRLAPKAELRIFPFDGFTVSGRITGGVRQTTVQALANMNQYMALAGEILPEDERLGYEVSLHMQPAQAWGVRVGASRREYESYLYFNSLSDGRFAPLFDAATVNIVNGDFYWKLDSRNELLGIARYTQGSIGGSADDLPYMPRWDAELSYTRRLLGSPVSLTGTARYIGERGGGSGTLDPAFLLGFEGTYGVSRHLDLLVEGRNLLGSEYQLWDGYQEQGLFVGLGARARF